MKKNILALIMTAMLCGCASAPASVTPAAETSQAGTTAVAEAAAETTTETTTEATVEETSEETEAETETEAQTEAEVSDETDMQKYADLIVQMPPEGYDEAREGVEYPEPPRTYTFIQNGSSVEGYTVNQMDGDASHAGTITIFLPAFMG